MNELLPTRLDIRSRARREIVALLNQHLADLLDLQSQAKHAHWNVRGRFFHGLHKTFDEVAVLVGEHIDDLAERIATLGGSANGTLRQAATNSRLSDYKPRPDDELSHAKLLSERVAASAQTIRDDVQAATSLGDPGTADLLTDISRALDKSLWLLEAHFVMPEQNSVVTLPHVNNTQRVTAFPFWP
jgi:starvation-inducible DNA-binding protein